MPAKSGAVLSATAVALDETAGRSTVFAHERRLYEAQRRVLHGSSAADRPVSVDQVADLARRYGVGDVEIVISSDLVQPMEALALPAQNRVVFHPQSLTLWIAVHEIAHLVVDPGEAHGREFVSTMVEILAAECGARCAGGFRSVLIEQAVPMRITHPDRGIFALAVGDAFVSMRRTQTVATSARRSSRWSTRAAVQRAARQASADLDGPVDIVHLV